MNKSCRSIVLKIASRCNLNCSYCYMYNLGDTTYLQQPKFFSPELRDTLFERLRSHVVRHEMKQFTIVFHGGEPLLFAKEKYRAFLDKGRETFADMPDFKLTYYLQTNGVLVDDEWCELFKEYDINVGFSMDGTRKSHDTYRVDHAGRGSYDEVVAGIQTYLRHFPTVGVITVLDIDEDPIAIYENLKSIGVNGYNILFPDNNYNSASTYPQGPSPTPIADWLLRLFNHYQADNSPDRLQLNLFKTFFELIMGYDVAGNELYGENENSVLVVETNGDIETVDTLKSCGHGFTKGDMNLLTNEFDEALETPLVDLYYNSHKYLADKCLSCPVKSVCGGGYITHRFSKENGFNNPSIYCKDLQKMIIELQNYLFGDIAGQKLEELGIELLSQEKLEAYMIEHIHRGMDNPHREFLESFKHRANA